MLANVPQNIDHRKAFASSLHVPHSLTTPFNTEVYGLSIFNFDDLKRANKDHPESSPVPLHRGDQSPHTGCMQALLPRNYPLCKGGDVPADLVLTVYDAPAALNIMCWRRDDEDEI